VNADVGDLNRPLDAAAAADREEHAQRLIELCKAVDSTGLVLPNGCPTARADREPGRRLSACRR
jgi:hypothetical protein